MDIVPCDARENRGFVRDFLARHGDGTRKRCALLIHLGRLRSVRFPRTDARMCRFARGFPRGGLNRIKEYFTNMKKILGVLIGAFGIFAATSGAQQSAPAQQGNQSIYNVTVVGKTVTAVSYQHRSGSTMIGFQGTPL